MDRGGSSSRYHVLERMLLDENAEATDLPLSLLQDITNDFSDDRRIGDGGFAMVYKGLLTNGTVAVKKLHTALDIDEKKFNQEVQCLMKTKHKNVVRFLGFCADTHGRIAEYEGKFVIAGEESRVLCFEYVPNGSLDRHITNASCGLEWRDRYRIIKGICEGLDYLHEKRILHLDLKPANILIDGCMEPKIADFGIARYFDENQSRAVTSKLIGTLGYLAPESYKSYNSREITFKLDIFSLGAIILEILTGEKGHSPIEEVVESWRNRLQTSEWDTQLKQVRVCVEIAMECLQFDPAKRPAIQHIIRRLDKIASAHSSVETGMNSLSLAKDDITPVSRRTKEPQEKPKKSLEEKQQENQDLLIKCVSQDLGFFSGRPIAALLMYKCLVHWRSFEGETTDILDRIIQTIRTVVEAQKDDNKLAYWLSNSFTLFLLLQQTLRTIGLIPRRQRSSASSSRRVSGGVQASPQSIGRPFLGSRFFGGQGDGRLHQVEAKYPALLFKQQLTAFIEKVYTMILENLKKEMSLLLRICIEQPRKSRGHLTKGSRSERNSHWQSIVKILTHYLDVLKANYVPPFFICKFFNQIFSFINVQLFNSLLLRREYTSFSNGEYVKAGLAELEQWCIYATEEYAGSSWEELKHIRQAVGFLVIQGKPKMTLKEITNDLCPVLSIKQLYRMSTLYWDDKYGTHTVSSEVISSMRIMMTEESHNAIATPFLLDDDLSIPFSVDEISRSMREMDVKDVDLPPLILENNMLTFLLETTN